MLGSGPELRVWDLGFRIQGLGLRVLGLRVWDLGFAFRFWASGEFRFIGFRARVRCLASLVLPLVSREWRNGAQL